MTTSAAWLSSFRHKRRVRMILLIAGLMIAAVGVGGWFYVNHALRSLPEWWAPMNATDETTKALGAETENEVVSTMNRVRGRADGSRWTITLSEDAMNSWLAARLPKWAANQFPGSFLATRIRDAQIHIEEDGWLRLGVMILLHGNPDEPIQNWQSVSCVVRPNIDDNGLLHIELSRAAIGRLRVPTARTINFLVDQSGVTDPILRAALTGQSFAVKFDRAKNQQIILESIDIEDNRIILTWRTEFKNSGGG